MIPMVALIILDGLGLSEKKMNNAVALAKTPYLDYLYKNFASNKLQASGIAVGLPEGQMGNSEVGHLNLGAGRIVYQTLTRINQSIKNNSFFENESFAKVIQHVKKNKSKLHVLGLVSDGGVHSHIDHFQALFKLIQNNHLQKETYLHAFTDGRDTNPYSGKFYLKKLIDQGFQLGSVAGRYYALDRDNNWERINSVYEMLTLGIAPIVKDPLEKIQNLYQQGISDEFIKPFLITKDSCIDDNDGIIFVNFRSDRAIRLAVALSNPEATSFFQSPGKAIFKQKKSFNNLLLVTMTFYNSHVKGLVAFEHNKLTNVYGEVIANYGFKQLRIAETEKYPHVTYFFDGGKELNLKNTDKILVPSPKVATYDLKPEMSAQQIAQNAIKAILSDEYQTMILNFANPDMVGHTGSLESTIRAVEITDQCLKDVVEVLLKNGGKAIIVADHGNAEKMKDDNQQPHTAHTTNLVPIIVTDSNITLSSGSLCDVAPTLLYLLGIPQPQEMTGKNLIKIK